MNKGLLKEYIAKLPKIELHVHIEGSLSANKAISLGKKNKRPKDKRPKVKNNKYIYSNFLEFKNNFYYASRCLSKKSDFSSLMFNFLKDSYLNSNIVYSEALFSPLNFKIDTDIIKKGIDKGYKLAQEKFPISINIILDSTRNMGVEYVTKNVLLALEYRDFGLPVIGVSIGGIEEGYPPRGFVEPFKLAKRNGLKLFAHAGEHAGSDYIKEAVSLLGIARIAHGTTLIDDLNLTREISKLGMLVDCCPTSNVCTNAITKLENHPLRRLIDLGVKVSINTDDPAFFNISLNDEILNCVDKCNLKPSEISTVLLNAVYGSFLKESEKTKIANSIITIQRNYQKSF